MALSIKTKIWLPAIAVSIGLVLMSTGSAVRTVKSQAITVKEQSDQQSKLELSARWRGLAEAQALRTLGAALAADEASAALLQGGQEQDQQELAQVQSAVATHPIVVLGMAGNPFVKRARKLLGDAGLAHEYIGIGSYFSEWRRRNALKMWTGWPTFPMVFVRGTLIGGADDLKRLIDSGELQKLLAA